jgi:hypothetical protein
VLDVEGDELGAAQRGGEPEQQQRPVAQPGQGGGVELGEDLLKGAEVERRGPTLGCGAVRAADPREDLLDRARIARVRMVLGAVRGGDRRRAAPDCDGPESAVGLRGQERRGAGGSGDWEGSLRHDK